MTRSEAIPSGTVSFLFTDLGRSTRLWEEHGALMNGAVALHDDMVRAAIDDAGGYVFTTAGDSFAAAFGSAPAAADAAARIDECLTGAEWPTPEPLRTRIGLHVGEAHRRDDDYFGPAVNRAARIMAAAHPGQVLASGAFVALLGPSAKALDLGEHRLKDLTAAEHLWQLGSGVFPPPMTLGAARHNLPAARTELLGRSEILVQLVDDIRRTRLLTLAGPGGVGKTRLALALGAEVLADQEDGVWVVDLTSVVDGARVVSAVAEATGVMAGGGEGGVGAVADVLARRGLLLVLDNCEHVLDECAELVDAILERDGRTKVVATSREPLDVLGELVRRIPPLTSEGPGGARRGPAVELFIERALAASSATDPGDWDEGVVAELCDRLDGMPLGIELAAAQTPHLSPVEILAQLDDRFVLLAGARRGRRHGHQTLQAVMDWSWDLLTDDEARALEDLSVLVGEWTLGPAARVAGLTVAEATAVGGRLVAKSLVVPASLGEWTTYRLLDTVRLYGLRRLADSGRYEATRDRHCAAFHAPLAELSPAGKYLDYGLVAVALRDWSNTTVAMDWALARGDAEQAAQLLSGTYLVWLGFDGLPPEEGYRRCQTVLESELSPATRAFTTMIASATAYATGRLRQAVDLAEAAVTLAGEVNDPGLLAAAASHTAIFLSVTDPVRARELCELAIDAGGTADEQGLVRHARQGLGSLALARGEVDTDEEVAAQLDDCSDGYDRFATLQLIVDISLVKGQPDRGVEAARAALGIYGRSARGSAFYPNFVLAYALAAAGDDAAAKEPFEIALAIQRATGLDVGLPDLLLVEARQAVNRGDLETARLITGAVRYGGVAG
ncbi:MAG: adenylate/guanylate cyclase domain-containing protein, partial [Ilumatobacter sp.]